MRLLIVWLSLLSNSASAGLICPPNEISQVLAIVRELKAANCAKADRLKEASQLLNTLSQEVACERSLIAATLESLNTIRSSLVLNVNPEQCAADMDEIEKNLTSMLSSKKSSKKKKAP